MRSVIRPKKDILLRDVQVVDAEGKGCGVRERSTCSTSWALANWTELEWLSVGWWGDKFVAQHTNGVRGDAMGQWENMRDIEGELMNKGFAEHLATYCVPGTHTSLSKRNENTLGVHTHTSLKSIINHWDERGWIHPKYTADVNGKRKV